MPIKHNTFPSLFSSRPWRFLPAILGLLVLFSLTLRAQTFYPRKDLVFTQVIAADGFESVLAVTNRGVTDYTGDLVFVTGSEGNPWTPTVNGEEWTECWKEILIPFGQTRVFRVTGSGLTVGYAYFYANTLEVRDTLEGNMTYYSSTGSRVLDAIGVPRSDGFLAANLPFSNFNDVGLSLSLPWEGQIGTALVDILLYNEDGTLASQCRITLEYGGHQAMYLWELPWETPLDSFGPVGRVEISSSRMVFGIAMIITPDNAGGAQISTLPLEGAPLFYDLVAEDEDENTYTGRFNFWMDGLFVRGYMRLEEVNEETITKTQTWKANGQLIGEEMKLAFPCKLGDIAVVPEVSLFISFPGFTPAAEQVSGTWSADLITSPGATPVRGTVILNRTSNGW